MLHLLAAKVRGAWGPTVDWDWILPNEAPPKRQYPHVFCWPFLKWWDLYQIFCYRSCSEAGLGGRKKRRWLGPGQEACSRGATHGSKVPLLMGSNLHFHHSVRLDPGSRPSELGFSMRNQVGDTDVLQIAEGVHMWQGFIRDTVLSGRCRASTPQSPGCKQTKKRGYVIHLCSPSPSWAHDAWCLVGDQ